MIFQCYIDQINIALINSNHSCIYPYQKLYQYGENEFEECKESTDDDDMANKISQILSDEHLKPKCPRPCFTQKISFRKSYLNMPSKLTC